MSETTLTKSGKLLKFLKALGILWLAIQIVPYGRSHTNPPVVKEPAWDSPVTRELFMRACMDCHGNETVWPWYSHVAPVSWLVQRDVDVGREEFNVSEWGRPENEGDESAQTVREKEMPPMIYLPTHPDAWLTDSEKSALINGLVRTFGDKKTGHGED